MIKPYVRICFEFPRSDYAVLKALAIERDISIKEILTDALMEIKEKWAQEDLKEEPEVEICKERGKE